MVARCCHHLTGLRMPPEVLKNVAGYHPDNGNRLKRKNYEKIGIRSNNPLKIRVATRNIAIYRDPAVLLIDHLKEIYIQGELDTVETSNWHAKVARKDYQVGLNLTGIGVDEPDAMFENYARTQRNYTGCTRKSRWPCSKSSQ